MKYRLTTNLLQRNAANLVFSLKEIPESIFIYRATDERRVNGKSLIGVLSGHFLSNEVIIIETENRSRVREIFNEFGNEV